MEIADRLEGCLKLGALGDALGYMIEFDRTDEIVREHGIGGIRLARLLQDPCPVVSDDTQMTLFTAEGILDASRQPDPASPDGGLMRSVSDAYVRWYGTQEGFSGLRPDGLASSEIMNRRRAPGHTCLSGCLAGAVGTPASPANDGDGCGGVMRVAPLAFLSGTASSAFSLGARGAALTHGHPTAWLSAGMLTHMLHNVSRDMDVENAAWAACEEASRYPGSGQVTELVEKAVMLFWTGERAAPSVIEKIGSGWNGREALAIAVYAVLASEGDPARCIEIGAFHSGDSDSTASVAGQMLGASMGWQAIKSNALEACFSRLDAASLVDEAIAGLSAAATPRIAHVRA